MIPKVIVQTWKTKNVQGKMKENIDYLQQLNPEYKYVLFDDDDCKKFLLEYFGQNYVNAFEILKAGAFKADLFRYCYLYINGGVYLDIDMKPLLPFRELISETDEFVSVVDRNVSGRVGIYQAFVATVPKHPILYYSLELSFYNIASRRSDLTLGITGPNVMAIAYHLFHNELNTNKKIMPGYYGDEHIRLYRMGGNYTYDKKKRVFKNSYEGYSDDRQNYSIMTSYYKDVDGNKWLFALLIVGIVLFSIFLYFFFKNRSI